MVPQPSGTVTLVFTDIEGSTRLLDELGADAYRRELARHQVAVRDAFAKYGGYEVDNPGDGFFYSFGSATEAVSAVREAMAQLAKGPIRVRVGIHTGEPALDPPRYVGMDVHRAARIMACGHGGQVVLSQTTRELLEHPDELRDLGEHRLKDLGAPLRLYQLGREEFPPLRSLYRTNLPVPATPFLGRERELGELAALLERDDVRLLTLTGPGGTGKTRLALQAAAENADRFPEGVWWVPLAPLRDPALVLSAVAQALETAEEPGRRLSDTLSGRFAGKRLLLVLDNAEHLLPQVAEAIAALRDIGTPQLLVTSRERLLLAGEQLYPVPTLADDDAAAMFAARARQLDPDFTPTPAVAGLCRRLDNLPLAIELAAARTTLFTPEQLLDRLGQRLDLLKGSRDTDPRQHTLRATIDWSCQLLGPDEQRAYRALSVFAGGCTLEAAEQICGADTETIQSLLDKNLLRRRDWTTEPRYWMLETIREHAAGELAQSGEVGEVEERHLQCFVILADRAFPELRRLLRDPWLTRMAEERDNFRVVLERASASGRPELVARIVAALAWGWWWLGGGKEGRAWHDRAMAAIDSFDAPLQARVLIAGVVQFSQLGDYAYCRTLAERARPLVEALEDDEGRVLVLNGLAFAAAGLGEIGTARSLWQQAHDLAVAVGFSRLVAVTTANLGDLALHDGHIAEGRRLNEEALRLFDAVESPMAAMARINLGYAAMAEGRVADARRIYTQSLEISSDRRELVPAALAIAGLSWALAADGESERAGRLLGAATALIESSGFHPHWMGNAMLDGARTGIRHRLDECELETLLREGQRMSFSDAARAALEP